MKYWIGILTLCIAAKQNAFADNLIKDESNQSITAILLGVLVIIIIFLMLYRRQKRRFND